MPDRAEQQTMSYWKFLKSLFWDPSSSSWAPTSWTGVGKVMAYMAAFALTSNLLEPTFDPVTSTVLAFAIVMTLIVVGSFCWWWTRVRVPAERARRDPRSRSLPPVEYGRPQASYRGGRGRGVDRQDAKRDSDEVADCGDSRDRPH